MSVLDGINLPALLSALCEIESGNCVGALRVEPSYLPAGARVCVQGKIYLGTGRYFRAETLDIWKVYRWLCACSLSPAQIMVPTAWRLGYRGNPWMLDDWPIAKLWVETYLREAGTRILAAGKQVTVAGLLDAYNTGNPNDQIVNPDHIAKGEAAYNRILQAGG